MKVPFLNLKAQYESIAPEVQRSITEVLNECSFSGGPHVERFEEEFSQFCGCSRAVGVGSGTEALWLTLVALGIKPGDEVITAPNSFIATAEAISLCGASPVFVDVDSRSYTMDPELLEAVITDRTRAIIPVHLFGQMADMDPIMEVAGRYGIPVVEDACQAHGASYKGLRAGSIGDAGCFSFYPGKNLGAYGEAGCVVTNNKDLTDRIRVLRDHGQSRKYYHHVIGTNGRMDGIQGAVLSVKLKFLEVWNSARRANADSYRQHLQDVPNVIVPVEMPYACHVYHIFAVRAPRREHAIEQLAKMGISCGVHYPVPIHLQAAYASRGERVGSYPVAEQGANEFISLPMFPELSDVEIKYVTDNLKAILQDGL